MTVKLKIYDDIVIIEDGVIKTDREDLKFVYEHLLNENSLYTPADGFMPAFFDTFKNNIELIEVIEDDENAIY